MNPNKEIQKKKKAAMQRALLGMKNAWKQGSLNEPLSGEAKRFSDMHVSAWQKTGRGITGVVGYFPDLIMEKYQRGIKGLPYDPDPCEFSG